MISVRVLGPFEVALDGRPVDVPGVRARAVLARLALEPGTTVSVDRLIDDIWGAATPTNGLNALQVRVSQLRSVIGRDLIRSTRPGYVLGIEPQNVDALAAEASLNNARRLLASEPDAALHVFGDALSQWRGPSFTGLGDAPFALAASVRWEELRLGAIEDRLRLQLGAGEAREHLPDLEALAVLHPLREPIHELLVRAYASLGRQADALGAYRRVRRQLVEELGIDPGHALQNLEAAVLRQDPSLFRSDPSPLVAAPTVGPSATTAPAASAPPNVVPPNVTAPSIPSSVVPAGNIARPISLLLHRDTDLRAVQELLALNSLVTVTGLAGVGKTRLALELAGLLPRRTHGIWFVGLEGTTDPGKVADSIAAAIGAPLDDPLTSLRSRLRGSDAMLIVDNCEHLGDGPGDVVRDLLGHCPNLTVLATSQRPLGVRGEVVWPLEPLSRSEALELFSTRVGEMNPRLVFDEATRRSADTICAALDDLPLAIELAARRCGVLGVAEMADRLRDSFEVLSDRASGRPERHQTLAGAIGWSYGLLFPDTQLLLQVVAAFPDGAPLDALEAVTPSVGVPKNEVIDLLDQLITRSLVVADLSRPTTRYRVLNSIRRFAVARSDEAANTATIHAALATWANALAGACAQGLRSAGQAAWLATIRDERASLAMAFDWLLANDPGVALEMGNRMYLGWLINGDNAAAAARLGLALAGATDAPMQLRVRVSACQALILARLGRHQEAEPIARWALANMDEADPHAVALTRSIIGQVHSLAGRISEGLVLMGMARAALAASGDTWAEAISTLNIALAHGRSGDHALQEQITRDALVLLRPHNDPFVRRLANRNLALIELQTGKYPGALASLEEALTAERSIGFVAEEAGTLRLIARAHRLLGHVDLAREALHQSLNTGSRIGDASAIDLALADLIAVDRAGREIDAARALLHEHHPNAATDDINRLVPALQVQIGALLGDEGSGRAREVVEQALAQAVEESDNPQRVLALDLLCALDPANPLTASRRADADRLAERSGVHAIERPDRT